MQAGGSSVEVTKGDKIRVIKGDLIGLHGIVVTFQGDQVIFKPEGQEGFTDNLQIDKSFTVKFFEPGDDVKVINGKYKGETGIVTQPGEGGVLFVALDNSNREVKIFANYLKLKSEMDNSNMNYMDKGGQLN